MYNKNINPENLVCVLLQKYRQSWGKGGQTISRLFPIKLTSLISCWKSWFPNNYYLLHNIRKTLHSARFLWIGSHVTESFLKNWQICKKKENIETDVPIMTADDLFDCFEFQCDEDEKLYKMLPVKKKTIILARNQVGIWCASKKNVWFALKKLTQFFFVFFEPWLIIILFCNQLIFRIFSVVVEVSDKFRSILTF